MIKCYIDLHIHTALSPCADNEMMPNDIVNMAVIKGLDFIAITDHNCVKNVEAVVECARGKNIIIIPGIEVETSEEIHVLCLFQKIENLLQFGELIYDSLPNYNNREEIFGQQLIFDSMDNLIDKETKLLITASKYSIDEVVSLTSSMNGIVIPAHIDRQSHSIINTLGVIPDEFDFRTVEVADLNNSLFLGKHKYLTKYRMIKSSDAHRLEDILEKEMCLELKEKSIECLFYTLKSKK